VSVRDEVLGLFGAWRAALDTGDPDAVVALYAPDGVLVPTFSNRIRTDAAGKRSYFAKLLVRHPYAEIDEGTLRLYGDVAIHSGSYTFYFGAGPLRSASARFTFVYRRFEDGWLIVEHHSSAMPEVPPLTPMVAPSPFVEVPRERALAPLGGDAPG